MNIVNFTPISAFLGGFHAWSWDPMYLYDARRSTTRSVWDRLGLSCIDNETCHNTASASTFWASSWPCVSFVDASESPGTPEQQHVCGVSCNSSRSRPTGKSGSISQSRRPIRVINEGRRIGPQTGSKKIKIPETSGINVLYPHVGVCRSFRNFFHGASCLRSYSTSFTCAHNSV